ncbi:MAG: SDR family oxidoreductase [Alphaproteobacteria bacterium]
MKRFEGKRCLVTAAGQGIGRAIALRLAAEGGVVVATDINEDTLREVAGSVAQTQVLDVTNAQDVARVVADAGALDVVVCCAGMVHHGTILECDEDAWQKSLDLNVTGMYRTIRACLPGMLAKGGGSIITIASVASSITGVPNRFAYGASKAAIIGLTKAVAADFVASGIRCNAVCPGTVDSPSLRQRMADTGDYDAARADFTARQPMGRLGTTDEIAALATYLASDEAGFTTGQIHVIDGGWTT